MIMKKCVELVKKIFCITGLIAVMISCKTASKPHPKFAPQDVSNVLDQMTVLMVHDITNPPLAARFFSYACLAGYEVVSQNDSAFSSMHGRINGYPDLTKPDSIKGYSYQLSALLAMMETAKKMQPSGKSFETYEKRFIDSCSNAGYTDDEIEASKKYALAISKAMLVYAKADGYSKISNYPRYTPLQKEGCWYPTPPAFMAAVEPYFNTVRPFALDSAAQFKPVAPIAYSTDKKSAFYQLLIQNHAEPSSDDHRQIAAFWDCNPFAVQDDGHLMMGVKKISPGAHWLGIAGIACAKAGKSFEETMQINTVVAMGLMDAFMCCWDEKFRSNRIRPETAIRKQIDPQWKPLLQTPPFPEYLSGHSVASSASATILTHYFGDNFAYVDTIEVKYGLPSRPFTSFKAAAQEAGVSRLYGGIHFEDAINNGAEQGAKVGNWLLGKVK